MEGCQDSLSDDGRQKWDGPETALATGLAWIGFILGPGHSPHNESPSISAADSAQNPGEIWP